MNKETAKQNNPLPTPLPAKLLQAVNEAWEVYRTRVWDLEAKRALQRNRKFDLATLRAHVAECITKVKTLSPYKSVREIQEKQIDPDLQLLTARAQEAALTGLLKSLRQDVGLLERSVRDAERRHRALLRALYGNKAGIPLPVGDLRRDLEHSPKKSGLSIAAVVRPEKKAS